MQECDLIMKGGITSGVVYPYALVEIAKDYRLRDIGGTSAGAIAAAFAAAAEYRRQASGGTDQAGFEMIGDLADELGGKLRTLLQPAAPLRPLFDILIAAVSEEGRSRGKPLAMLGALTRAYRARLYVTGALVLAWLAVAIGLESIALFLFGALLTGVLLAVSLLLTAGKLIFRSLPAHGFGLCPGTRQPGYDEPGFTDWIADKIDLIAGNTAEGGRLGDPLTVGQLRQHKIGIATMTTDLSSQRPYQLPFKTAIHYFSESELKPLLPQRVVDYLVKAGGRVETEDPDAPADLYRIPFGDDFPVLLVARLSLSFPGLISAMGLYRHDNQAARLSNGTHPVRRCLFSDGGISSNFPIHFFDAFAPVRPTFGIALGTLDRERDGEDRIHLPTRGRTSTALPVTSVDGLGGFLFSIVNTAKDWQDTMQSMLPGYAERIVTVRLDESREGGLNLAMDAETIGALTGFGREAGSALRAKFSYKAATGGSAFDQHRYNRAISLLPEIEQALVGYAEAIDTSPVGTPAGTFTGSEILTEFDSDHYRNSDEWRLKALAAFSEKLARIGDEAVAAGAARPRRSVRSGNLPSVDSALRLVAKADRVPQSAQTP